jgi:hypothetical protein
MHLCFPTLSYEGYNIIFFAGPHCSPDTPKGGVKNYEETTAKAQVVEIPPRNPIIVEHRLHQVECQQLLKAQIHGLIVVQIYLVNNYILISLEQIMVYIYLSTTERLKFSKYFI